MKISNIKGFLFKRLLQGGDGKNTKLFSKEYSKKIFLENSLKHVEADSQNALPQNFNYVSDVLFSMPDVYVSDFPSVGEFSSDVKFIKNVYTISSRGMKDTDIINEIKRYLNDGCEIYMYAYYVQKHCVPNQLDSTMDDGYWWRYARIKKK